MRSREISVSIIIQNLAQLKALFEKQWESIVGNCDEFLYLGGNEQSTHEYVSKLLGKSASNSLLLILNVNEANGQEIEANQSIFQLPIQKQEQELLKDFRSIISTELNTKMRFLIFQNVQKTLLKLI